MAGNIENIVDPTRNKVVTIVVPACPVAGKVITGVGRVISFNTALVIAKYGSNLPRPGLADDQIARSGAVNFFAIGIE